MIHIFIINPVAGLRDRSEGIRQFLERKPGFSYLVFDTEDTSDETDIVKRMLLLFDDEKIRFYICGGSGSFAKALKGIPEKDFPRVEMANYPCGLTNDFIKNFGRNQKFFYNMDNLIRGEVIPVDFMKSSGDCDETSYNHVLFSTIGLTEQVERFAKPIKILGGMNADFLYVVSFLCTFMFNPTVEYTIDIDGEDYSGAYDMLYIGNSICMGGSFYPVSDASPDDGVMEIVLLNKIKKWKAIGLMNLYKHGEIENHQDSPFRLIRAKSSMTVSRKDGKCMNLNVDGEINRSAEWKTELMSTALNYVVPRGSRPGQWI